ncbi:diguanylate cyclase [Maribrevibacterium harenarium]|uniref:Diguanylate cyclase n=1 Tax=Maribrevibacterium harenarium TaxID=2589817 RepID=A0A501WXB5_9GAMM|nr:GGDEF domain-containing protein [Maribrevibacterium harenarium]TPE54118.1 diguanylate cyclase [Maribrevibacterium harenarium]
MSSGDYSHLIHIRSHEEVALYELIPDVVWFFDLDKHGWWWGNSAAVKFWGLDHVDELINKDLSGDTQGAKDRTAQTFELAAQTGLTIDPWTTYPNGKPKTLYMRHRAVLLGPEKHRGIIAFINEEVNLGETPENLLMVEAMRYTNMLVTSFDRSGNPIVENPAATETYKHIHRGDLAADSNFFVSRFVDQEEGRQVLAQANAQQGGLWTCRVNTAKGVRKHTLDVRITRHPLSGDFLLLMSEYDVTPLHEALDSARAAQDKLRKLAHYDAVTGVPSLHYLMDKEKELMRQASRGEQPFAVLYIDLDGFKAVNDQQGHEAGNLVLTTIGARLHDSVKEIGGVVRLGGDEFLIWCSELADKAAVQQMGEHILSRICEPVLLDDRGSLAKVSASIGVAFYHEHGDNLEDIIRAADKAMYQVKHGGKCGTCFAC